MTAVDDRAARALEGIERNTHEAVKIFVDINDSIVQFHATVKEVIDAIEQLVGEVNGDPSNVNKDNCSSCGQLYCTVLGCNPEVKALSCGCSPNYCCCSEEDRKSSSSTKTVTDVEE